MFSRRCMIQYLGAGFSLVAFGVSACGSSGSDVTPAASNSLDTVQQEIIGGVPSDSTTLNAVGMLGTVEGQYGAGVDGGFPSAYLYAACTGTLVGPTAVVTTRRCVESLSNGYGSSPAFAIGSNAKSAQQLYPIVDWDLQPEARDASGSSQNDIAVVHLGKAVQNVQPFEIASLDANDVGKRFGVLGFAALGGGVDIRRAGSVTLRGIGGNVYDYLYGDYQGFKAHALDFYSYMPSDYELEYDYKKRNLVADYEAYAGKASGDAQPAEMDVGGPLVAYKNGKRFVYGIVSRVERHPRNSALDMGTVFAIVGPQTQTFLTSALAWVDPCVGTTVLGHCDSDLAVRCTARNEGKRRLTRTDCSILGQTCRMTLSHVASCADPNEPDDFPDAGPSPSDAGPGAEPSLDAGSFDAAHE